MLSLPLLLLLAAPAALALHAPGPLQRRTPEPAPIASSWSHPPDHPVNRLFRRETTDGVTYPPTGSADWLAGYPPGAVDVTQLPQPWVDALNAAVAAGLIPDIPQTNSTNGSDPVYPNNANATSPEICSSTYQCQGPGDIWNAPDGVLGTGFDDGPLPPSQALYTFLQSQNQKATHYMIGTNIIANPNLFSLAYDTLGHDIAVHTWTHPYLTTFSNLQIVGELGWTMQLIHNSTGGRVPKYYRPPYGDADNRVRAIAKQVFNLEAIIWNQDTEDWSIGTAGGATVQSVAANLATWITGPKSPGLIILEHELTDDTVQGFISAYPSMVSNGWKLISQCDMANAGGAWANANGTNGTVLSKGILAADLIASPPPSPSSTGVLGAANATSSSSVPTSKTTANKNAALGIVGSLSWMMTTALVGAAVVVSFV